MMKATEPLATDDTTRGKGTLAVVRRALAEP